MKEKFPAFYDKHYKKIPIISAILLLIAISYLGFFYVKTGDIIKKDISLTGGTTITVKSAISALELKKTLSLKISDLDVGSLSDGSGKQTHLIITSSDMPEKIVPILEEYLGYKLTEDNSSIEFTGSSLSNTFYRQLIPAVLLAFLWMSAVVFLIFSDAGIKTKVLIVVLNLAFAKFLFNIFLNYSFIYAVLPFAVLFLPLLHIYKKYFSVPSFAVTLSAFADIVFTLAIVNFIGMKVSASGIVAFLMLIGYSVDTDIMLDTRMLKRKESTNKILLASLKTGLTETLTSLFALVFALPIIFAYQSVINEIFIILIIGLAMDIYNTWVTNAAIIKWYVETK
ncbi:MAG: hypothetical protein ACOYT4_01470 [Nanoarchaeota archaeon]